MSTSTFKIIMKRCFKEYWQEKWDRERNFKIRLKVDPFETCSRAYRIEEKVLCRLRTGVTLLTHMLPWIGGRPFDICEECYEVLSIKHILLDCLTFHRQRQLKRHTLQNGYQFTVFRILQDDIDTIDLLFKYLRSMNLLYHL